MPGSATVSGPVAASSRYIFSLRGSRRFTVGAQIGDVGNPSAAFICAINVPWPHGPVSMDRGGVGRICRSLSLSGGVSGPFEVGPEPGRGGVISRVGEDGGLDTVPERSRGGFPDADDEGCRRRWRRRRHSTKNKAAMVRRARTAQTATIARMATGISSELPEADAAAAVLDGASVWVTVAEVAVVRGAVDEVDSNRF